MPKPLELQGSAVSWSAILAGATAAAVISLVLLILGTGLGLSAVSPWYPQDISAIGFGVSTIVWLTLTQLLASGMGGYIAGRLRTRWVSVHQDEVYFRDTAHGFLAWGIASLATAGLLTSLVGSIVGTGTQAAATVVGGATVAGASVADTGLSNLDADSGSTAYFLDSLLHGPRKTGAGASGRNAVGEGSDSVSSDSAHQRSELTHIFMNSLRTGPLPTEDASYAAQLIAQRTGLTQQEAQQRVDAVYGRMQANFKATQARALEVADQARKASAYAALWLVVSMLVGAFIASWTAVFGGRQRDK
jgi:hypothetical protein